MSARIQRRRTKGWRMPKGAVYVGRPTIWGNPFNVTANNSVEYAVRRYRFYAERGFREWQPSWHRAFFDALRGLDLSCWCPLCDAHRDGLPLGVVCPDCAPCHADVLLELAS
jgi:hypothetical protein